MAKQKGIIKLKGTMGDISFYKTQDGHVAREKGGVEASRIAKDPAFQRTRENGAEFGRAGKSGKTLRDALRLLTVNSSDNRMVSRLLRELMTIIKTDTTNPRGERSVVEGSLNLLQGFEFNIHAKLSSMLFVPYTMTYDRAAGSIGMNLEAFVPNQLINAPQGATHIKVVSGSTLVDFVGSSFEFAHSSTDYIAWDTNEQAALDLGHSLTAASQLPLLSVLGVSFYQEVNGIFYPLKNGAHNALSLVYVNKL